VEQLPAQVVSPSEQGRPVAVESPLDGVVVWAQPVPPAATLEAVRRVAEPAAVLQLVVAAEEEAVLPLREQG